MLIFNVVLLLILQVLKVQTQCDFNNEMLCGDECISSHFSQLCQCGSQILNANDMKTFVCCNTKPCQNATCPDGIVQLQTSMCNGQCPIHPQFGHGSFLCENFNVCRPEDSMCKGITMCGNSK